MSLVFVNSAQFDIDSLNFDNLTIAELDTLQGYVEELKRAKTLPADPKYVTLKEEHDILKAELESCTDQNFEIEIMVPVTIKGSTYAGAMCHIATGEYYALSLRNGSIKFNKKESLLTKQQNNVLSEQIEDNFHSVCDDDFMRPFLSKDDKIVTASNSLEKRIIAWGKKVAKTTYQVRDFDV